MGAWGTAKLRDEATVFLLTRDGYREGDILSACCWCGLPFWWRSERRGVYPTAYCSKECFHRWFYRRSIVLRGKAHLARLSLASKRRAAARRAAAA